MLNDSDTWDAAVDTRMALSFLPQLVHKESQNDANQHGMKSQSHQLHGICLFINMCVFQAEIDRGLSRDTEGLSIIASMTNTFVGSLVNKVYAWGGDVVEFTGSALICLFLSSSQNKDDNVHEKALQCAWQLNEMSPEDVSIRVRIRMGYGDLLMGFLGGFGNQWRYVFTCLLYTSPSPRDS